MQLLTCPICGKSDIKSGHGLSMHQKNSPNCLEQQKAKDLLPLQPSVAKAQAKMLVPLIMYTDATSTGQFPGLGTCGLAKDHALFGMIPADMMPLQQLGVHEYALNVIKQSWTKYIYAEQKRRSFRYHVSALYQIIPLHLTLNTTFGVMAGDTKEPDMLCGRYTSYHPRLHTPYCICIEGTNEEATNNK